MYIIPTCSVILPDTDIRQPLSLYVNVLHHQCQRQLASSKAYIALWRMSSFDTLIAYHWLRLNNYIPVFLNDRWTIHEVSRILSSSIHCNGIIIPHDNTQVSDTDIQLIQTTLKNGSCPFFVRLSSNTTSSKPYYNLTFINRSSGKQQQHHCIDDDDEIAAVFFTSGSTSVPKAVPLTDINFNVVSFTKHKILKMSSFTIYLHLSPLFHLGGFSSAHATSLINATHVFSSPTIPHSLSIQRYDVTHLVGVPSVLSSLAKVCPSQNNKVQIVFYGGGGMSSNIRENIIMKTWPFAHIIGAYGMTEASSSITFLNHSNHKFSNILHTSAGFIPSYITIKISSQNEILIKGKNVFKGYFKIQNNKNVIIKQNEWFNTGDLGYIHKNTGALFIHGRKYDVIKAGGENVFAPEVEQHLLNQNCVTDAAVVGVPDEKFGTVVGAVVQLQHENNSEQILKRLHKDCEVLSEFKRPWWIVALHKDLPRTATGKIMKEKVHQLVNRSIASYNNHTHHDLNDIAAVVPRPSMTKTTVNPRARL